MSVVKKYLTPHVDILNNNYTVQKFKQLYIAENNNNKVAERILFITGGSFVYSSFNVQGTELLENYKLYLMKYPTLLDENIDVIIGDVKLYLHSFLESDIKTTIIGYSAGVYIGLKALENVDKNVMFIAINGYFGTADSVILNLYSWKYLQGDITLNTKIVLRILYGSEDSLKSSSERFINKYYINKFREINGASHLSFYDKEFNSVYINEVKKYIKENE